MPFFVFVFTENCLQMNNFVGGITGPPLPFAPANNNLPNSVTTSYVTRHKKFFLKKLYLMIFFYIFLYL